MLTMSRGATVRSLLRTLGATALSVTTLSAQHPAPPRQVSLTETAVKLATSGVAHHNPRAVMAAAEILRLAERGSARVRLVGTLPGPSGPWQGPLSSAGLLRLASEIAADQGDWAAADYAAYLLQRPDSEPVTRGAAGGPVWADAFIARGQQAVYTIDFSASGQSDNLLQVTAGNAGALLECALQEGGEAAKPTLKVKSLAGACTVKWRQPTAGRITLRISNTGPATYFVVSSN